MNLASLPKILKRRFLPPESRITRYLERFILLLRIPPPDSPQLLRRITIMERDIVLPIKTAGIAMLLHSFYVSRWIGEVSSELEIAVEAVQAFLLIYIIVNTVYAAGFFLLRHLAAALLGLVGFVHGFLDGLFFFFLFPVS